MTRPETAAGKDVRARRASVLAAILGTVLGRSERPLPELRGGDAAVDGAPVSCEPRDATLGFSLCGVIDGRSVSYLPPYLQTYSRGASAVTFEAWGPDGPWLDMWGPGGRWTDYDLHQISGWLLRPPLRWASVGTWFCGQAGTITRHADGSFDGTLSGPSILPACGREGGPESLHFDLHGGFTPFDDGGGCVIGFRADDARFTILAP